GLRRRAVGGHRGDAYAVAATGGHHDADSRPARGEFRGPHHLDADTLFVDVAAEFGDAAGAAFEFGAGARELGPAGGIGGGGGGDRGVGGGRGIAGRHVGRERARRRECAGERDGEQSEFHRR